MKLASRDGSVLHRKVSGSIVCENINACMDRYGWSPAGTEPEYEGDNEDFLPRGLSEARLGKKAFLKISF